MWSCTAVQREATHKCPANNPSCDCRRHRAHVCRISAHSSLLRPADIIGHVGVDFVALQEGSKLRMWAVDLKLQPTASLCSFQVWGHIQPVLLSAHSPAYCVMPTSGFAGHQSHAAMLMRSRQTWLWSAAWQLLDMG